MSVKRWKETESWGFTEWDCMAVMEECADGEYVLHSDYAALLAATHWRPIETAPKDGTLMLTYSARCGVKLNVARLGDDGIFLLIKCNESWAFALDTTHWMPLPKPPSV